MKCSKCGKEMKARIKKNIKVDECQSCGSLWFDTDEFRKMKDAVDEDLNWMDFEIWKHEKEFRMAKNPKRCPKCQIDTVTIQYGNTNLEVDYCTRCKGMWLAKGEFKKIIDSLENELLTKSVGDYWKATLKEAKEIISSDEGLISEWRDFITVLKMMEYRILTEHPKLVDRLMKAQIVNPIR